MKNLYLLILAFILIFAFTFIFSCNQDAVNLTSLENIDGKIVVKGETEMYSGQVVTYYCNGKTQLVEVLKDGKKHGKHTNYYKSGKKKTEGEYEKGKRKGVWRWWSEKGEIDFKVDYSSTVSLRF